MDEYTVHPRARAGDPFEAAGSRRLRELRDRYRHELMDDEERQELRDRIQKAATPEEREMECPACGLVWHADGYDRGGVWYAADEGDAYCGRCGCEGTA